MGYLITLAGGIVVGAIAGTVIAIKAAKAAYSCEPRKSFY